MSQSPQTGQFNSYVQENLFVRKDIFDTSQSPQTGQFNSYTIISLSNFPTLLFHCLNPLKRVNSILTVALAEANTTVAKVSIPSNGSIQFLL